MVSSTMVASSRQVDISTNRKLSHSRNVTLPIIKLNDAPPSGSPRLLPLGPLSGHRATCPSNLRLLHQPGQKNNDNEEDGSPIGHTLRFSEEDFSQTRDLNRHTVSESFGGDGGGVGPMDIRIFYSNGKAVQVPVEDGMRASAGMLLERMSEHLEVDPSVGRETLSLWLVSPLLEIQLKPHHLPCEVHSKWAIFLLSFANPTQQQLTTDEPLLVIKRNWNLALPREEELTSSADHDLLTEVLYLDAKEQYMTGRYLVPLDTALLLAALQLSIDVGPYVGEEEAMETVQSHLLGLVPSHHLPTIRSFHLFGLQALEVKEGLEGSITENYKRVSSLHSNAHQRRQAYLRELRQTPFYGASFFPGTTEKRAGVLASMFGGLGRRLISSKMDVLVGINHQWITVIDPHRHELLLTQPIREGGWMRSPEPQEGDGSPPSFLLKFPYCGRRHVRYLANGDGVSVHGSDDGEREREMEVEDEAGNKRRCKIIPRLLQIFSKQTVLIEATLYSLYSELDTLLLHHHKPK